MPIYKTEDFIPRNSSYHLFCCAEARSPHMHSHDFYEIAYVYEGSGKHYTNFEVKSLKEGDFILLSPGFEHSVTSLEDSKAPWIRICNGLFDKNYFNSCIREYSKFDIFKNTSFYGMVNSSVPFCLHLSDNEAHTVKKYIWSMKYEYDLGKNCIDAAVKNLVQNFLIEANRICDFKIDMITNQNDEIKNLIEYMQSNLHLNLTLDLLAAQIHLSPEYLSRYFKKATGKNVSSYLMELRISKAKRLLAESSYPITEICHLCGYSSLSNFRKYFGKITGMSPSDYRKLKFL
ncbi:MAG: AraC family transcriptional regulator [Clostridia bacterium]|nr:AraC family transcriptional regulator [Clostridia bacterium]